MLVRSETPKVTRKGTEATNCRYITYWIEFSCRFEVKLNVGRMQNRGRQQMSRSRLNLGEG
jgi:hypothetical protein